MSGRITQDTTVDPGRTRESSLRSPRVVGFRETLPLLRPYRRSLVGALLVGLLATIAGALQPAVVSTMVDAFGGSFPVGLAVILVVLLLISATFTAVRQLILQRAGERFAFDTRERLVRHIYALPLTKLEGRERADLVSRVTADVAQTRAILSSGLVELASSGVTVLVSIAMMAFIDPVLLGLTVAVVSFVLLAVFVIGKRTRPAGLRLQRAVGDLAGSLSRALSAMKTVRATLSARREADATVGNASRALEAGLAVAGLRAVIQTFTGVAVQILLIVVVGVGALRVAAGELSVGELSAFIMYLLLMAAPISLFGSVLSMLGEAFGALSRILEVEAEPQERDIESHELISQRRDDDTTLFLLEKVSFRYREAANEPGDSVLKDVTLEIKKGATTALVGPSGAGKTTLFALLERFYEPSSGRILFQGQDVRSISREALRSQIAYVEQDAPVLSGSVGDNLRLGAPSATDDRCAEALVQVNLAQDLESARRYLEQEVGEIGSRVSGGERQRLAIARAIIARTPILLLDEVTSNLDSRNEILVQEIVRSRDVERTVVVIAHRFSTVIAADTIVVLDQGHVVAQGRHRDLFQTCDLYRELAEHQLVTEQVGAGDRG